MTTLGPNVYKYCLLWAIWSPRDMKEIIGIGCVIVLKASTHATYIYIYIYVWTFSQLVREYSLRSTIQSDEPCPAVLNLLHANAGVLKLVCGNTITMAWLLLMAWPLPGMHQLVVNTMFPGRSMNPTCELSVPQHHRRWVCGGRHVLSIEYMDPLSSI